MLSSFCDDLQRLNDGAAASLTLIEGDHKFAVLRGGKSSQIQWPPSRPSLSRQVIAHLRVGLRQKQIIQTQGCSDGFLVMITLYFAYLIMLFI